MLEKLSRHPLITGSFILTLTGLISRLIGFFYRIYLSRIFTEEGMGIYQLISPVLAFSFSLTAAGFQTVISRFVAEQTAPYKKDKAPVPAPISPLIKGLSVSLPLSILLTMLLSYYADKIAVSFLAEERTAVLLRIMALSIPPGAVHACINGYFYGLKKAGIPAAAQLLEQCSRVAAVYCLSAIYLKRGQQPPLALTSVGLLMGELISTLFASLMLLYTAGRSPKPGHWEKKSEAGPPTYTAFLSMLLPLMANRAALNILQSIENVSLPLALRRFGYDNTTALSVYGVLTGMAFPLVFFPNALTGSLAVLLLPMISEKNAAGDMDAVRKLTAKTIQYCCLLGFGCMLLFLLFGNFFGSMLFQSELAGFFITTLGFICPFLYLNNTLSAILQGMGKVIPLFFINVAALLIRLLMICFFVPVIGIRGYLWGLLAGQIFQSTAYLLSVLYRKTLPHGF